MGCERERDPEGAQMIAREAGRREWEGRGGGQERGRERERDPEGAQMIARVQ